MPDHKPNILLIQADQLTPFLTGAYGNPVVQTPNPDRLCGRVSVLNVLAWNSAR